jgi:hypothetical protein
MKNYISQEEGVWFSLVNYIPNEEQLNALKTLPTTEEENTLRVNTLEAIKSASRENVTAEEKTELDALYNANKPVLKSTDVYVLIEVRISNALGLINCKVNGEHKQIRF